MAFNVTLAMNGGDAIPVQNFGESTTYRELFKLINPLCSREGYTFAGWYSAVDCVYANHPADTLDRNTWMYARWCPVEGRASWYMNTLGRNALSASFTNQYIGYVAPFASYTYHCLWGHTINAVRFQFAQAGTFYIQVYPEGTDVYGTVNVLPTATREVVVDADHENDEIVTKMFEPITIQSGEVVAIGFPNGTANGPFKYVNANATCSDGNILKFVGGGPNGQGTNTSPGNPNIDIGYIDNSAVHVNDINLPSSSNVAVGESETITAEVLPADAGDKGVTWTIVSGSGNISISPVSGTRSCTVTGLAAGQAVVRATTIDGGLTAETTFYVNQEHTYYINFESNDGSECERISFNEHSDTITLPTPVRAGYHFVGWFERSYLYGDIVTTIPSGTTKDYTLYAKWVPQRVYDYFHGKSITFVGDSVTTYYEDKFPNDFYNIAYSYEACHDPDQRWEVITRNTTGYGQFIQALDMELKVLDCANYAGVCYESRSYIMASNYQFMIDAIDDNGVPDVICIFIGVNDLYTIALSDIQDFDPNAEYVTGPLDTTTVFQSSTDYTRAYVTMIRRMKDRYPDSEIMCFTTYHGSLPEKNAVIDKGAEVVHDICQYYNMKHVNFAEADMRFNKDGDKDYTINGIVHPGNYGFKVLNDFAIQQLDHKLAQTVPYTHLMKGGKKIRVDAAVRDGVGRKIDSFYVRTVNGQSPVDGNINLPTYATQEYVDDLVGDVETILHQINGDDSSASALATLEYVDTAVQDAVEDALGNINSILDNINGEVA